MHVMHQHVSRKIPVSGTGVLGRSSFQHNDKSVPIVTGQDTSRTSCDNNGQLISQSNTDNGSNGQCGSDSVIGVSMDVNNNGNNESNVGANTQESGKHLHSNQVSDVTECGHSSIKANVFDACQGGVTPDNVTDNVLLYDVNIGLSDFNLDRHCSDFSLWKRQTDYTFGFVPLTNLVIPDNPGHIGVKINNSIEQHFRIRPTGISNFLGERIPVQFQLNVGEWKKLFQNYWDQQLIHLIEYGFPLDFNSKSVLHHDGKNHSSAIDFPVDVQAYLDKEIQHGAIMGPFDVNPIPNCHISPFMTREKPNAPNRRVIIDLSWPKNASVNAGVDKNSYLGSEFSLTFPTIDDITKELVKIGSGCHIYKIRISRAFRHLKIDPGDYDLLGLCWDAAFLDTCLPFGSRHGNQNFQHVSNAVHYVLCCHGYRIINYIDDFAGYGTPDVVRRSFDCSCQILERLGLTISEKKMVEPTIKAICLGILIDTIKGTIPDEKMRQIKSTVTEWQKKQNCTKRLLQSLLGQLLYVRKCVRPARVFLNTMLDLLHQNYDPSTIRLTQGFRRDLRWFSRFLEQYNGVSMYNYRKIEHVELDACLDSLGGVWKNYVYHLQIPRHYLGLTIVYLEMVNILVAIKTFGPFWAKRKICANQAVVPVLTHSKTKDAFLAACARNLWLLAALYDLDISYVHIKGKITLLQTCCPDGFLQQKIYLSFSHTFPTLCSSVVISYYLLHCIYILHVNYIYQ